MPEHPCDIWYGLMCRSRARMGITLPPFRWRYMRKWWAIRFMLRSPMKWWRWVHAQ